MLVPVRVVVDVCQNKEGEERTWFCFYKDTELPNFDLTNHGVCICLQVGSEYEKFQIDKTKPWIVVEKIPFVVIQLIPVVDTNGNLVERFFQNWVFISDPQEAIAYPKTDLPKKPRKLRAKKVIEELVEK